MWGGDTVPLKTMNAAGFYLPSYSNRLLINKLR